jgi:hypothetical protein
MDLFQKIGLPVLHWTESVKLLPEEESKIVKSGVINDSEGVYLIEMDKKVDKLTNDNFMGLYSLTNLQLQNFLKLKYLLIREDQALFLAFEKTDFHLSDYLSFRQPSVEVRLMLFRGVIEVIHNLISLHEEFTQFDPSLFFIEEREISVTDKFPVLKFIYHGKIKLI